MKTFIVCVICIIAGVLPLAGCLGPRIDPGIPTANVDLERYVGKWYEIASIPTWFSRNLVCVTATYTPMDDGRIEVLNKGFRNSPEGQLSQIRGTARVPDPNVPGRLRVSFFPPFSSAYNVIALDEEEYSYAMVTSSTTNFLWILSRTPELDSSVYESLVSLAEMWGFPVERLEMTPQICTNGE